MLFDDTTTPTEVAAISAAVKNFDWWESCGAATAAVDAARERRVVATRERRVGATRENILVEIISHNGKK